MKNLFGEAPLRVLAFAGLIVCLFLAYLTIQILLVPFVAALFVVYLFEPVIVTLQRRGMDRGKAFLALLCLTLMGIMILLMVMPSWLRVESLGGSSSTFTDRISKQLGELERWADSRFPMLTSIRIGEQITAKAGNIATRFFEQLPGLVTSFLLNLLLVPFIAYFMIRDGKAVKRRIVELVPNRYFE